MQQETVTLVVAGMGIGGTLGGIVVGHLLTRSWQRKQWLLDNKKQEYKKLITLLTTNHALITRLTFKTNMRTPDDDKELVEAHAAALTVIRDRVFIGEELKRLDVFNKWLFMTKEFNDQANVAQFRSYFEELRELLVSSANRELK